MLKRDKMLLVSHGTVKEKINTEPKQNPRILAYSSSSLHCNRG